MMVKKCSNFHWYILRGFNFIETAYELFDNPSYKIVYHYYDFYVLIVAYCVYEFVLMSVSLII